MRNVPLLIVLGLSFTSLSPQSLAQAKPKPVLQLAPLVNSPLSAWLKTLGAPKKKTVEKQFDNESYVYTIKGLQSLTVYAKTSTNKLTGVSIRFKKGSVKDWKTALQMVGLPTVEVKAKKGMIGAYADGKALYGWHLQGVTKSEYTSFTTEDGTELSLQF